MKSLLLLLLSLPAVALEINPPPVGVSNAATATALAANGANCSAGQFPLGVDASGAAESCTAALTGSTNNTFTGTNAFNAAVSGTSNGLWVQLSSAAPSATIISTVAISNTLQCEVCWRLQPNNNASLQFNVGTAGTTDTTAGNFLSTSQGLDSAGTGVSEANAGANAFFSLGRVSGTQTTAAGKDNSGCFLTTPTSTSEFTFTGTMGHKTPTPRHEGFRVSGVYTGSAYTWLSFQFNTPGTNTHTGFIKVSCYNPW